MENIGEGYDRNDPPEALILGGGGKGAAADVEVVDGAIAAVTIENPGTGYDENAVATIGGTLNGAGNFSAKPIIHNGALGSQIISVGNGIQSSGNLSCHHSARLPRHDFC